MTYLSEADIENALLEHLESLGYTHATDAQIGPDGSAPEREAYSDVLLLGRLTAAIDQLNPLIPAEARHDALMQVVASASLSLIEENRRLHKLIVDGVAVEFLIREGPTMEPSAATRCAWWTLRTRTPTTGWRWPSSP